MALLWIKPANAAPFFSEFFANPTSLEDNQGEFLEVYCEKTCENLRITLNQETYWQGNIHRSGFILFCASVSLHPQCIPVTATLTNSSSHTLQLWHNDSLIDTTEVPQSLSGISWERANYQWVPTATLFAGDLQSPGFGSLIHFPNQNDQNLSILTSHTHQDTFFISYILRGEPPFLLEKKESFSNTNFHQIDTISNKGAHSLSLSTHGHFWNFWTLILPYDELPNPPLELFQRQQGSLFISEIFPFPKAFSTEWIEVQNNSPHPFPLFNTSLAINNAPILWKDSSYIPPHSNCILSPSKSTWSQEHSQTPSCFVEIQHLSLSNQGGTLYWNTTTAAIDTFTWQKAEENNFDQSIQKQWNQQQWLYSIQQQSPGEQTSLLPIANSLQIPKRALQSGQSKIDFNYHLKANSSLHIQIYDRSGLLVWQYKEEQSGKGSFSWNGLDQSQRFLQPGLYILQYIFSNETPQRKAIAIAPSS